MQRQICQLIGLESTKTDKNRIKSFCMTLNFYFYPVRLFSTIVYMFDRSQIQSVLQADRSHVPHLRLDSELLPAF